jgi:very-short-patch-repair endonuclease
MTPELRAVARRQAGCFTHRQALQCGVPPARVNAYLADGEWLHVLGEVLIVAGAPVTEAMKAWTGVLAIGQPVRLAGRTAARWLNLERAPLADMPQFQVPNNRRPRDVAGLDVGRVTPANWSVVWARGLPVAPIPTVIRDMAATGSHDLVRDVVQHALRRRRVSFEALAGSLGRGHPGARLLRGVLEEVGPGFQVKWERILHRALLRRGVRMRPQTPIEAPDGRKAFIDLGIEALKYGVEIDGFLNHMARFAADRRRFRMVAVECGWIIAPYAVEEIADHLDAVADEIAAEVQRRQRRAA